MGGEYFGGRCRLTYQEIPDMSDVMTILWRGYSEWQGGLRLPASHATVILNIAVLAIEILFAHDQ